MPSRTRLLLLALLLALLGCGGSGIDPDNAARLRFFNAFADSRDVRVLVGGKLNQPSGGARVDFGTTSGYGKAPAGTVNIQANLYSSLDTAFATLTGRTLLKDRSYTAVGITSASTTNATTGVVTKGTDSIVLLTDTPVAESPFAWFRFVNAVPGYTRLYYRLTDEDGVSFGLSNVLAFGGSSGYDSIFEANATGRYVLRIYSDEDETIQIGGDVTITLADARMGTVVLYPRPDSTNGVNGIRAHLLDDGAIESTTGG